MVKVQIVAKIIRTSCKGPLIACSCKCIGCILKDLFIVGVQWACV